MYQPRFVDSFESSISWYSASFLFLVLLLAVVVVIFYDRCISLLLQSFLLRSSDAPVSLYFSYVFHQHFLNLSGHNEPLLGEQYDGELMRMCASDLLSLVLGHSRIHCIFAAAAMLSTLSDHFAYT